MLWHRSSPVFRPIIHLYSKQNKTQPTPAPGYHITQSNQNAIHPGRQTDRQINNTYQNQSNNKGLGHGSSNSNGSSRMAPALMTLHIGADTERLPAPSVRALEGLLTSVRVGVDAQRGRTRECLVACAADVAVMGLLVGRAAGGGEVVMVLPGWCAGGDDGSSSR